MGKVAMLGTRVQTLEPRVRSVQGKPKRKAGKALQTRRQRFYERDPRCALCRKPLLLDEYRLDHVVALVNGGQDTDANLQGLCVPCHDAKTREDMRQARGG